MSDSSKTDRASARTVSVIVPTWNGCHLLESVCLPALSKQTFRAFKVTVVDNGSRDGTVDYLRTHWPEVTVIDLPYNIGFAAAVNAGIVRSQSDFVALVNNDVELHPRWLEEIVAGLESLPDAGSVASKILDFDDRTRISTVGDCVSTGGNSFWRGFRERDVGQYDEPEPIFSACAAAALYRRDALNDVGPFDEDFFAYAEDVDWGFRAQIAGYSCWIIPTATAYHMNGATSSTVTGLRGVLLARNTYWLILKNFPARVAAQHLPGIAFVVARRFYRLFRHDRRLALQTVRRALALTPRMLEKRRMNYARRAVSDRYLHELLDPSRPASAKLDRLHRAFLRLASVGSGARSVR